jgi:mannose-6-phosphate isomerase
MVLLCAMEPMQNEIQRYAWGSHTAIAALRGVPPSGGPEAELWMGAHPIAPSRVGDCTLVERIARAPEQTLGPSVIAAFGPRLPFLLKVLAARQPLSLQAHPSLAQAEVGFDREEAAGVPRTAPNRNYKDRNHKPELVCALTPFDALCGFREPSEARALFERIGGRALGPLRERLASPRDAFSWLVTLADPSSVIAETVAACKEIASGPFAEACAWSLELHALHPRDAGVVSALLLNHVRLAPGEAIYLPAGNLHAYLRGVGVEIMASSDNVLRGGLTEKHVDVPELLSVLDFSTGAAPIVRAAREGVEEVWHTPAREFRLSRVTVHGSVELEARGPEILLGIEGDLAGIARGGSVFVPASDGRYRVSGRGVFFRATVGPL